MLDDLIHELRNIHPRDSGYAELGARAADRIEQLWRACAHNDPMTTEQIIEVGKALLPYLRNDLTAAELGTAAHDAVAALRRSGRASGLSDVQRLAISCGNEPYADDKVCPKCNGLGYV